MPRTRSLTLAALVTGSALLVSCSAASGPGTSAPSTDVDASAATSAADFGGMDALIAAAQAEGELNLIAVPEDWAKYGEIIDLFEEKYDITVNSANPEASSAEAVAAAEALKGQDTAPDVFDNGSAIALANEALFAPYKVETWDSIPDDYKHPEGLWVYDYTGIMAIAYDADAVPAPTSLQDLLGEEYKGAVALNGDPTQAGAAIAGVQFASLLNGGSADDIQPGIDFFDELNKAGNFLTVDATNATIASGETPVVFNWSYLEVANQEALKGQRNWQLFFPEEAAVGAYYNQSVNAGAPNPAAARLWQEHLYSDEVQNIWLSAGAFPARLASMIDEGTVDQEVLSSIGEPPADLVQFTSDQSEAASAVLAEKWAAIVS